MAMVMELSPTEDGTQDNFCLHYVLEEAGLAPEEEQKCTFCETTWLQRLDDNVERMAVTYTTSLPCLEGVRWSLHATPDVLTATRPKAATSPSSFDVWY